MTTPTDPARPDRPVRGGQVHSASSCSDRSADTHTHDAAGAGSDLPAEPRPSPQRSDGHRPAVPASPSTAAVDFGASAKPPGPEKHPDDERATRAVADTVVSLPVGSWAGAGAEVSGSPDGATPNGEPAAGSLLGSELGAICPASAATGADPRTESACMGQAGTGGAIAAGRCRAVLGRNGVRWRRTDVTPVRCPLAGGSGRGNSCDPSAGRGVPEVMCARSAGGSDCTAERFDAGDNARGGEGGRGNAAGRGCGDCRSEHASGATESGTGAGGRVHPGSRAGAACGGDGHRPERRSDEGEERAFHGEVAGVPGADRADETVGSDAPGAEAEFASGTAAGGGGSPGNRPVAGAPEVDHGGGTSDGFESLWATTALTMNEPGEFIAAVPALLGFRPHRSLVACLLLRSQKYPGAVYLGAVARHDLDVAGCGAWVRLAGQLAAICGQEQAVGVVVLIVDDRATASRPGRAGRRSARHRDLIRTLDGALQAEDVLLAEAWAVADIAAGAHWWSVLDPEVSGTQSDPAASPVALAQVLDGRPIRGSRTELTATIAPDPELAARVDEAIDAAAEAARRRFRRELRNRTPRRYSRAALEMVLWQISTVESGDELDPRELADLAVAVRDTTVRDCLFAVALGDHAAAAETLWARACRAVTGPDRAELATLYGYSAYTRGDGPLAGVAFEAALQADPAHHIAQLLDAALRTGMRPADVRKLAGSGRDIAAGLGVDLHIAEPGEPPVEGPRE